MSTHRTFPEVPIVRGEVRAMAMQITCAHCGAVEFYAFQNGVKRKPPIAARQAFQGRGWSVGSGPRKDFCPLHAAPASRREKDMSGSILPKSSVAGPSPVAICRVGAEMTQPKAEPPRQMTREDRQIIHAKLSDVYDKGSYLTPWTDARVASDLGVPRAWVSEIRDLMFGPENSNPAFDEFLTRVSDLKMAIARLDENEKAIADALAVARRQREKLLAEAEELRLLQKRIEKELGR